MLAIGGSTPLGIVASSNVSDYLIDFNPPVTAFGFWVQHNSGVPGAPVLDAIGAQGIIESASLSGAAIDGTVPIPGPGGEFFEYGFLGAAADEPITSVRVRGGVAVLNNLRFISVPEPSTMTLVPVAALACVYRTVKFARRPGSR